MRKLLAVLVLALVAPVVPVAARLAAFPSPEPRVAPQLAAALEASPTEGASERLVVFVHGRSLEAARSAAVAAGLDLLGEWSSIDVAVAGGTPAQVRGVIDQPGVTYVEPNVAIDFTLDTARIATRTADAQARTWPITETTTSVPDTERCRRLSERNRTSKHCPTQVTTTTREVGPFTGAGRSIAIVDSGIDGTHPMFAEPDGSSKVVRNMKLLCMNNTPVYFPDLAGQGQFPPDNCPADAGLQDRMWVDFTGAYNDTDTPSAGGHGTHVASIAAGNEVTAMDRELAGTAPGAKLVGLSIGGGIGIYGANTALDWITRHHDKPCGDAVPASVCPPITVVNNSYGSVGGGDFEPESATAKLQRLLVSKGVVMVWANGNGDALNDGGNGSDNRSNGPGQDWTPGIISVANYDDNDTGTREGALASSSSRGERGRRETYPDISAPGSDITAACRPYLAICTSFEEDPNYGTIGGTSMAAPHVAGIVATLQEAMVAAGQEPSPAAIEDTLEDTAYKFTFGAAYEPDLADRNADGTTSFDKGHGLADTYNAISRVFGVPASQPDTGGTGAPPCPSDTTGFTDEQGDASIVGFVGVPPAYDARLDLTSLTMSGNPLAETASFRFGFAEVDGADPSAALGVRADLTFSAAGTTHTARILRSARRNTATGTLDGNATGATVEVDQGANTITLTVPRASFGGASGELTLSGLGFTTRRDQNALAPVADDGGGSCPVTIDVGGSPAAPVEPDPSTYDATLDRGGAHSWTGTPMLAANPMPTGDVPQCVNHTDPRCDTTGLWIRFEGGPASLRITFDFDASDDFDVFLFDAQGSEVARKASGDNPEVLTTQLTQPGVYYVSVSSWLSSGGEYSARATLS